MRGEAEKHLLELVLKNTGKTLEDVLSEVRFTLNHAPGSITQAKCDTATNGVDELLDTLYDLKQNLEGETGQNILELVLESTGKTFENVLTAVTSTLNKALGSATQSTLSV